MRSIIARLRGARKGGEGQASRSSLESGSLHQWRLRDRQIAKLRGMFNWAPGLHPAPIFAVTAVD
jgi:hypothetical protein